jgi:thioredoxin-like negative regulator of GroEL
MARPIPLEDGVWFVHARDCDDCREMRPKFLRVARRLQLVGGELEVQDHKRFLVDVLHLEVTPSVVVMRAGRIVRKLEGPQSEEVLRRELAKYAGG